MEQIAITVQILGKDYRVGCLSHERDGLLASAKYLNEKLREIKNSGKIVGSERMAVMAALNISHELLQARNEQKASAQSLKTRLQGLQDRISIALDTNNQLQM